MRRRRGRRRILCWFRAIPVPRLRPPAAPGRRGLPGLRLGPRAGPPGASSPRHRPSRLRRLPRRHREARLPGVTRRSGDRRRSPPSSYGPRSGCPGNAPSGDTNAPRTARTGRCSGTARRNACTGRGRAVRHTSSEGFRCCAPATGGRSRGRRRGRNGSCRRRRAWRTLCRTRRRGARHTRGAPSRGGSPCRTLRWSWPTRRSKYCGVSCTTENGGDKLVHGSGGISQPRAE